MQSIRTIIIADAAMGIDNVIAVAGAAGGDILLVILGLVISIPIVVWGSTLFIKIVNKYEWVVYIGSAVLAYTAAKMITHEKAFLSFFSSALIYWLFIIAIVIAVVLLGYFTNSRFKKKELQKAT